MANNYWTRDRIVNMLLGIAGGALLLWLVSALSDVLLPFAVACFAAYLLQPMVRFNQRWTHRRGRVLASILTLLEVLIVVTGLVFAFMPTVTAEVGELSRIFHEVESGERPLPEHLRPLVQFVSENAHPQRLQEYIDRFHIQNIFDRGRDLLSQGVMVVLKVLSWMLCLIYIVFILIDYPRISRGVKLIFPRKVRPRAVEVVREVQTSMNRYFRGQGLVALCATVLYCTGFAICGLPLAIPLGLLVGILYMIPYFQYVTVIPVAAVCFLFSLGGQVEFWPLLGKCGLVYLVSQSICDYIITPHVMGKEMGLNPAVILLSLSIWGSLLGIIGMIIALPATSLIMTYYERYISERK